MIFKPEQFLTRSLRNHPDGTAAARVLAASLNAVDPARLIKKTLDRKGSYLHLQDTRINLDDFQRLILLGIGKAALPMSLAAVSMLEDRLSAGLVLSKGERKASPRPFPGRIIQLTGGHPLPDRSSLQAGQAVLKLVSALSNDDLVLIVLSGGGSALLSIPAPSLTLTDLIQTNRLLLACGADIQEINAVRKHISAVKGGRLAQMIHPARSVTLILSDVMGNRLDSIASGLTVADTTSFSDALQVVQKYDLPWPERVLEHLRAGRDGSRPETPKPGNTIFNDHLNLVVGSNQDARAAAAQQAKSEGFQTALPDTPLQGEARIAGRNLAARLAKLAGSNQPLARPACWITGGETTVTLTDRAQSGKGGRNLELALSAIKPLAGAKNCALISLATDGEDGVTQAAGAVATGESLSRALQKNLDPTEYLAAHNSFPFFNSLEDLLITGPTGTNVNDLCFLFTFR